MAETGSALIFTGQGYVEPGMGLVMKETLVGKEMLEEVDARLPGSGIVDLLLTGTKNELVQTDKAQLATYIRSAYDLRVTHPSAFHPYGDSYIATDAMKAIADFGLGHSLGEFTAMHGTGALTFSDGLLAVDYRGRKMQELIKVGAQNGVRTVMTAVTGLREGAAPIAEICHDITSRRSDHEEVFDYVSVANYNGPMQTVIGGTVEAVEEAEEAIRAQYRPRRIDRLDLPAAFHTRFFDSAINSIRRFMLNGVTLYTPVIPLVHNLNAEPNLEPQEIAARSSLQVANPVLFTGSIGYMGENGLRRVEIFGPGSENVGKMVKATLKGIEIVPVDSQPSQ